MKILLGDCDEKVRRGNIFKPTSGNESYIRIVVIMMLAVLAGFGTSGGKSAGRIYGHFVSIIRKKSMLSPSSCPSVCPRVSTHPPLDGFS